MNQEEIVYRFQCIFSVDDLKRISLASGNRGQVDLITIDVHGLTCREARRFISNTVNLTMGHYPVRVIHGYRHGTAIRDMLRKESINSHIHHWKNAANNMGVTTLVMCTGMS